MDKWFIIQCRKCGQKTTPHMAKTHHGLCLSCAKDVGLVKKPERI